MRASLYQLLASDEEITSIVGDRIFQASAVDQAPPRPFLIYRLGGVVPVPGSETGAVTAEVWAHDDPGSYVQLDNLLRAVKRLLRGTTHYSGAPGERIATTRWESDSTDLFDDGYRTNTKYTRFTLVGRGI